MEALEFSLTTFHLTLQTDTQSVQKHLNIIIWKNNNKLTLQSLRSELVKYPNIPKYTQIYLTAYISFMDL